MIEVFKVGTKVLVGGDISAEITAITIRNRDLVSYQVVWWNGLVRQEQWVESFEVKIEGLVQPNHKIGIGFKGAS